jgi:hypothetical protein
MFTRKGRHRTDYFAEHRSRGRPAGPRFERFCELRYFWWDDILVQETRGLIWRSPVHTDGTASGVSSKAANWGQFKTGQRSGPERLEVVPDRELAMQGKTGLFPQSSKKIVLRRPQPRFLEAAHGSGHGFSDAWGSVGDLVLQLRGPHLRM